MTATGMPDKGAGKGLVTSLDDAMLLTGFGVYNMLHLALNGLILMGVILTSLGLGYVLPAAQCDLNLTTQQQGLLTAIPFLAVILASYVWGWLGDTRGRKPVMLYTMLLSCIFAVFTSFSPNVPTYAALQFITSIFASGPTAMVYTYHGEFNSLRYRDKMVTFGSAFVGIGTVVLPAISWLILPLDFEYPIEVLNITYRPWRLLIIACFLPYALSTVCLFFAPESPKFLYAMRQHSASLEVVKKIYSVNKRKSANSFPVQSLITEPVVKGEDDKKRNCVVAMLASMKDQTVPIFKMPLLPWTVLTCFVQFGIFATTNGFYVWFPTILNSLANHNGVDTRICDILESVKVIVSNDTNIICDDTMNTLTFERSIYIGLVFSSMYVVVGFLVDFVGKKYILITILIVTGACGLGAHLAANQQAAIILFGIFQMCGACIGIMNAVTVEMFPTKLRAMALCLAMMMGRVGSMIGSNILGFMLHTNCGLSFYLFGSIIIVNGLCCMLLPGKKKIENKTANVTIEPTLHTIQTHEPE